ncbi:protein telomere ends associated-like isoform X2 [Drosophila ficusphila]|uniref:protein telomere ends associated-like isoform X2 n=1 Tax=Drosophila ficusphila TaxID=30025 RepID=UPI0007E88BF3|nr:protein telomere ends associated-like isoform X2 [Drosophila ficusphila]
MSVLKGKSPLGEQSLTNLASKDQVYPVTLTVFKRLITNLPKIASVLRSADGNHKNDKTDDDYAQWYYQAFYKDPSIREKYQFEVAPCPHCIREKLLKVPDPEVIINAGKQQEINQSISKQVDHAKSEAKNLPRNLKLGSEDHLVKQNKFGTFAFPVSFETFERNINKLVVFRAITKDKEHGVKLLADDEYRLSTLRNFYFRYYIFARFRGKANFFKECPPTPLAKLLEFSRPYDAQAVKSVSVFDARKNNENFIASFEEFKRSLLNLNQIVESLKMTDENYAGKVLEECAYDYYMAFYLTPDFRHNYKFQLRPCATEFQDRLLAFPPCPAKLREKLLSLSPKFTEQCPKETACQVDRNLVNKVAKPNKEDLPQESAQVQEDVSSNSSNIRIYQPESKGQALLSTKTKIDGNKGQSTIFSEKNLTNENLNFTTKSNSLQHSTQILETPVLLENAKEQTTDLGASQKQEILSISSSEDEDAAYQIHSGGPTQPIESIVFNVGTVSQDSQLTEIAGDPLKVAGIADVSQSSKESMSLNVAKIKQEPIKFLNNERCNVDSNSSQWEKIEEQIIDLDSSQEGESIMSCFLIPKLNQMPDKMGNLLLDNDQADVRVAAALRELDTDEIPCTSIVQTPLIPGKRPATSETGPNKRMKPLNERVPQVKHDFRKLLLKPNVHNQSEGAGRSDPFDKTQPQPSAGNITPSQELPESSQLHALIDSTNINTRKRL